MYINRDITDKIKASVQSRPAILLTGARQTGKSTLLRHLFPNAAYATLDRPLEAEEADESPSTFLDRFPGTVIIDEIQRAPNLFRELKIRIDRDRSMNGRWILTGSQQFAMMKGVSESLAGRISILRLETLSSRELSRANLLEEKILWRGGYPELWVNSALDQRNFFSDYLATYLERDLRQLIEVNSLRDFDRFLRSCALRSGQLVNYSELSADVGISGPTGKKWLETLVASGIIAILEPYFLNSRKRLVKSPKLFFRDHGLLCFMLNVNDFNSWQNSPHKGAIWENFVFSQLIRDQNIYDRQLFYWRDKDRNEIDFVIEYGDRVVLVEAKASESPDIKSIAFEKAQATFVHQKIEKWVACRLHKDSTVIKSKSVHLYNPIYQPLMPDIDSTNIDSK